LRFRRGVSEAVGALIVLLATLAVAVPLAAYVWMQAHTGAETRNVRVAALYCVTPTEQEKLDVPNATWLCWVRPLIPLPAGTVVVVVDAHGASAAVRAAAEVPAGGMLVLPAPHFPKYDLVAYAEVSVPGMGTYVVANVTYVKPGGGG